MHQGRLDLMIEFAVGELASGDPQRVGALVRRMAESWPDEKALAIGFALTSAASALEDMLAGEESRAVAARAYKLAALVSADVLAIEALGQKPATGRHLLQYWRRSDPWFLNL